jgi:hypothetical protein
MAKQSAVKSLPPALPLLVGLTAGVLAALVVDVQLAAKDMSVAAAWSQLIGGEQVRFASASALWAIAGIAFVAGAATASLLGKYPPPWRNQRALRWIIGALILFGLAHVAHGVSTPHGVEPGIAALGEVSAIAVAAIMALFGAFFARPR